MVEVVVSSEVGDLDQLSIDANKRAPGVGGLGCGVSILGRGGLIVGDRGGIGANPRRNTLLLILLVVLMLMEMWLGILLYGSNGGGGSGA